MWTISGQSLKAVRKQGVTGFSVFDAGLLRSSRGEKGAVLNHGRALIEDNTVKKRWSFGAIAIKRA